MKQGNNYRSKRKSVSGTNTNVCTGWHRSNAYSHDEGMTPALPPAPSLRVPDSKETELNWPSFGHRPGAGRRPSQQQGPRNTRTAKAFAHMNTCLRRYDNVLFSTLSTSNLSPLRPSKQRSRDPVLLLRPPSSIQRHKAT